MSGRRHGLSWAPEEERAIQRTKGQAREGRARPRRRRGVQVEVPTSPGTAGSSSFHLDLSSAGGSRRFASTTGRGCREWHRFGANGLDNQPLLYGWSHHSLEGRATSQGSRFWSQCFARSSLLRTKKNTRLRRVLILQSISRILSMR